MVSAGPTRTAELQSAVYLQRQEQHHSSNSNIQGEVKAAVNGTWRPQACARPRTRTPLTDRCAGNVTNFAQLLAHTHAHTHTHTQKHTLTLHKEVCGHGGQQEGKRGLHATNGRGGHDASQQVRPLLAVECQQAGEGDLKREGNGGQGASGKATHGTPHKTVRRRATAHDTHWGLPCTLMVMLCCMLGPALSSLEPPSTLPCRSAPR